MLLRHNRLTKKVSSEDIVQETMLKAWRKSNQFAGTTTEELAKWLLTILRNTFLDWCKKYRLEVSMHSWFDLGCSNDSPSRMSMYLETEALLQCRIAEFDPISRKVIVLRLYDGLKFHEIAEKLDVNPNSAASIYRRGLKKLHDVLAQYHLL